MKHLVPLLTAQIRRDITTTVNVTVPEHELDILRQIHGDNVFGVSEKTADCSVLDPSDEFDRLCRKYGEEATCDTYGNPAKAKQELRKLIEAASAGTQEDDMSGIRLEGPDSLPPGKPESAAKPKRAAVAA